MNYNPYAAPTAGPLPPTGPVGGGTPQPWDPGEVLGAAWAAFQNNAPLLIGVVFVFGLVLSPMGFLPSALSVTHTLEPGALSYLLQGACSFGNLVVDAFLSVGLMRITLAVARGQQASFADLFGGASHFLSMLAVVLIQRAIELLGCCVFGLVVVYMGLCFAGFYVVDQNLGPIDALKEAWRATEGQHGEVLVYSLLAFAVYLAGFCACGVGVFVSMPVAMLGFAIIYLRISGGGAAAKAPGAPGPGGPLGVGGPFGR